MEKNKMKKLISLTTMLFLSACGDAEQKEQMDKTENTKTYLSEKVTTGTKTNGQSEIPKADVNTIGSLKERIDKALSDVSCNTTNQCYVISTGSNPCGGASGYAVLSSKTSNQEALANVSNEIIRLEKSKHALEGTMGICQHLVEPKAMCSSNQCIAVESDREVY